MALAQTAAPTLVAELAPVDCRALALGLYYACWGVGTLIASGVCYGVGSLWQLVSRALLTCGTVDRVYDLELGLADT